MSLLSKLHVLLKAEEPSFDKLLELLRTTKWPAIEAATKDNIVLHAVQVILTLVYTPNARFTKRKQLLSVAQLRSQLDKAVNEDKLTKGQANRLEELLAAHSNSNQIGT